MPAHILAKFIAELLQDGSLRVLHFCALAAALHHTWASLGCANTHQEVYALFISVAAISIYKYVQLPGRQTATGKGVKTINFKHIRS